VKTNHLPGSHHAWVITSLQDSVDIEVRQMPPGPGNGTNWLPSPAGPFELRLRIYLSSADGLAEDSLPPIQPT
jgi:hypothetical protein